MEKQGYLYNFLTNFDKSLNGTVVNQTLEITSTVPLNSWTGSVLYIYID